MIGDDPEGFSLAGSFELEVTVADEFGTGQWMSGDGHEKGC